MISCEELFEAFKKNDLTFFTGVPDSTFKDFMSFLLEEHENNLTNIIASNECEAIAIAAGYHLATKKIGVVYMQNSGEGKTVNPLTSLCDKEVYSIPLVMIIGWRGEPGKHDEPQHKKMGRITLSLLDTLEIPYQIISDDPKEAAMMISNAKNQAQQISSPVALIIKSDILEKYTPKRRLELKYEMSREDAIKEILDNLDGNEIIISTTGKTSRELFEERTRRQEKTRDFYTVGSMGCSASIALGIALQKPQKKVFVFDGDGAVIMQMGALATIGHYKPKNLRHIIFDNESHESTGAQPTVSSSLDFVQTALSCGYGSAQIIKTRSELKDFILNLEKQKSPSMTIIKANATSRKELGRPTSTPLENKQSFMQFLEE